MSKGDGAKAPQSVRRVINMIDLQELKKSLEHRMFYRDDGMQVVLTLSEAFECVERAIIAEDLLAKQKLMYGENNTFDCNYIVTRRGYNDLSGIGNINMIGYAVMPIEKYIERVGEIEMPDGWQEKLKSLLNERVEQEYCTEDLNKYYSTDKFISIYEPSK